MSNPVYILGGAQSDFQRNWSKEGKGFITMLKEVTSDLLTNVGIDYEEIKKLKKGNRIGIFVGNFAGELYFNQAHLGAFLGLVDNVFVGIPGARYEAACASGSVAIDVASCRIKAGEIDMAIVIGIEQMKTVDSKIGADYLGTAAYYTKEAQGIEFPFPNLFGKLADAYIEKYQLDEKRYWDNLAEISAINYENAKRNPKAQTRSWFMNLSHANDRGGKYNPYITGSKLSISDCSQITDGAVAVILASAQYKAEYLRKHSLKSETVSKISGSGQRVAPMLFADKLIESYDNSYILPWTRQAIIDALDKAKLKPEAIDFYETHDCFTSSEYMAISAFGLTLPGEEFKAVESGMIRITGAKPINPSGGLIGVGHPVGASGVRMLLDLHKQVTSQAGQYQVKKANKGMMLNIGGSATTNYAFIVVKNVNS